MSEQIAPSAIRWPTRKQEAWKYTDLAAWSKLMPEAFSLAPAQADQAPRTLWQGDCARRLVWLDGAFQAAWSHGEAPQASDKADQRTCSALKDLITHSRSESHSLALSSADKLIHLVFAHAGDQDALSHLSLDIEVPDNSEVTIIEEHVGGRAGLASQQLNLNLGANARVQHVRLQHCAATQMLIAGQHARLANHARLFQTHIEWGGRLSRLHSTLGLEGQGAECHYYALSGLGDRQHVDHQVEVRHEAAHAISRLRARGIVGDSARQVFNGKVYVARGAQKTDSDQLLRNLLLSDKAEVDAKPELEIYADDVRCAHGSTVGRLDDAALFYLRSRGLNRAEARRLLMLSFAERVLREIPDEALRHQTRDAFADHLSLQTPA